jgi:hypothetical protein
MMPRNRGDYDGEEISLSGKRCLGGGVGHADLALGLGGQRADDRRLDVGTSDVSCTPRLKSAPRI